jgi:serine/threonine protein kinase/tetratricopeptide (TPR) repeat protein
LIGRTLSHYRILAEISRGGMGVVYRAVDLKLDREVAVKVLPPELVADPERKRRFIQEAKAAAKLEHPHIGVVHEIDEVDGVTFIVMELIRGEQLRDVLATDSLPLRRSLEIATDVAEGLAKAHEEGIVHRDVKPANIMVTDDGHTKIIDFGLAKLVEPLAGEGSDIETLARGETDPGKVMGTVSYMSPEQARGHTVDHRSDIFSFGIVLHEMVSGRPPFQGPTGADTLNAILSKPPPRLPSLGADASDQAGFELQHIAEKCLAKDPGERYQTIKDVVIDLRNVRRRLESGPMEPAGPPARRRPWAYIAAGLAAGILLAVVLYLMLSPTADEPAPVTSSKPSIAVLYFENASGDSELDWLRTGLTDMLVTDLSQSPNLSVLSTDRLYQILRDMNRLEERITSLEVVQEVAREAVTDTVILGSFMKAGDNVRINIRVQDARSGEILTTEKIEGVGESSIFSMVDDLTRRIKANFALPSEQAAELDPDMQNVTTSSIEAYRHFAEGRQLLLSGDTKASIPLLERALELDPQFAYARFSLSMAYFNTGQRKKAEEQRRIAMEHAERLPLNERYSIQGSYYALKEETYDRAFETLVTMLEIYPDHCDARNNLALRYLFFERIDEAIYHYEEARRRRCPFVGVYTQLAQCYARKAQFDASLEVLREYLAHHPDSDTVHQGLGYVLASWGRLDEALAELQKAESIRPGNPRHQIVPLLVYVLREEWDAARAAANQMRASNSPTWISCGSLYAARIELFRGRSQEALAEMERAIQAFEEPEVWTVLASNSIAEVLLDGGKAGEALEQAQTARIGGEGNQPEWEALFTSAIALANLGRWDEAERTAEELGRVADRLPTEKEKRRHHQLLGELALAHGDTETAIKELGEAQSMLTLTGLDSLQRRPPHVPIWFSLAKAYRESGDEEEAAQWFQRVADSTNEHVQWPIPYVRSFYFLGKIHESRGDMEKTREYYRRFYEYWKDGDMDRERVEEAGKKISTNAIS